MSDYEIGFAIGIIVGAVLALASVWFHETLMRRP